MKTRKQPTKHTLSSSHQRLTQAQRTAHLLLPLTVVRGELLFALHETVAKHEHHRVAFAGHELGRRVVQLVQNVLSVCIRFARVM